MSARARAAVRVQEAFLAHECEDPVDLLEEAPRDVATGEARPVAEVLISEHTEVCTGCRAAGYVHSGRGLPRFTRESAARRSVAWLSLCPEGKQIFVASWTALGLGLPEYAQGPAS